MKARVDGIDLSFDLHGEPSDRSRPWLVFAHSLAMDGGMWDAQAAAFAGRYRVLVYDGRGHGRSAAPGGAYTLDELADDLAGLLRTLDVSSAHVVGLSMGGIVGMTFALRHPDRLASLTVADSTSRFPDAMAPVWSARIADARAHGMEPFVGPALERWFTPGFRARRPDVVEHTAATIRATPVDGFIGCCHAIPTVDLTHRLRDIRCPLQIVVGREDAGTPLALSEAMHRAAPGSRLTVIDDASHLSNLEQPAAFNAAVGSFLDEVR